jgi:hypothetical protein
MAKLTLSIEDTVIQRAKRYAKARRTSVSELVETYLDTLSKPLKPVDAPMLRSIRGTLKRVSLKDYRKHLARKYR